MKNLIKKYLILLGICLLFCAGNLHAQIWKKIANRVKSTAEAHVLHKTESVTGKLLDKSEEKAGAAAGGVVNKGNNPAAAEDGTGVNHQTAVRDYKNYDFEPGDKIIFEPDLSGEADNELPARFTVQNGNAEIQSEQNGKVVHLDRGSHVLVTPLLDNDSYLPEQFTIELDMKYDDPNGKFSFNTFGIQLRRPGEKNFSATPPHNLLLVSNTQYEWGDVNSSRNSLPDKLQTSMLTPGIWHHLALYVRKNMGKGYVDQYRVASSNNLATGFGFIAIATDGGSGVSIKNVRIAAGGSDKYNKVMTDGKFVTNGILFEPNKATIQPTSMGTLNEICQLMKAHQDLKFEIDGHTDSDGDDQANMLLSGARANAVKDKLTQLGVGASRLTTKGFGETRPIDSNTTGEGKANNRRVEFIKR